MVTMERQIAAGASAGDGKRSLLSSLRSGAGHWCSQWFGTCADYYAAAALYEDLARLSDDELKRRGLDRATLARDICSICERER
jgi:hypothetical protein